MDGTRPNPDSTIQEQIEALVKALQEQDASVSTILDTIQHIANETVAAQVRFVLTHVDEDDDSTITVEVEQSTPETILLDQYKRQYENLPHEVQMRFTWEELEKRLQANNNQYLQLACGLRRHGILFGVDGEGNPLFADAGCELLFVNLNYQEALRAVYGSNYNELISSRIHIGYEMFEEEKDIRSLENQTQEAFVCAPQKNDYVESWLYSGSDPIEAARSVEFSPESYPGEVQTSVDEISLSTKSKKVGIRRLLRIRNINA